MARYQPWARPTSEGTAEVRGQFRGCYLHQWYVCVRGVCVCLHVVCVCVCAWCVCVCGVCVVCVCLLVFVTSCSALGWADSIGLHRIENPSHTDPAVSLHLYCPPITTCHTYEERTGHAHTCSVSFYSKNGQICSNYSTCA